MASKNGNNEGSIRKRANGKWEARFTVGRNAEGKQVQRSIYGNTRSEVSKKMNEILNQMQLGSYILPNKIKVADWMLTWLQVYATVNLRQSSYISCEGHINNYINPVLGGIVLKNLTTQNVQTFYNSLRENGGRRGEALSAKTIRNLHSTLHKALDQACKNNLIPLNVAENVIIPKLEKREMRVMSRSEQQRLLSVLHAERLGFAILLDISTGLRIGELCGLKWEDIDLERKVIHIRRTLQRVKSTAVQLEAGNVSKTQLLEGNVKTDSGFREVPIQDKVFEQMLGYRNQQAAEKSAAGCAYVEQGYVFASPIGGCVEPSTMRDVLNRLLKLAGIKHANFHSLRHTFATRAIECGVPIKAVSDILGHASIQITLDLYCHSSMDLKRESVDKMAGLW